MSTTPAVPLLKRVPPGAWTVLAWCGSTLYTIAVGLPGLGGSGGFRLVPNMRNLLVLATVLTVAGSVCLARRPLAAFALILAGAIGGALVFNSMTIAFTQFTTVAVALVYVAAVRPRQTSLTALGMTVAVLLVYGAGRALGGWPLVLSTHIAVTLAAVVVWFIGDTSRQTREHAHAVGAHAMAQAATGERLRIARELHDMVAHTVGVIALQAGAAAMLIDAEPAKAREAVRAIESSSRETLSGLRRMLGSLRSQDSDSEGSAPAPGLADLDRLAAATTAAGVRVEIAWRGHRRPLPPEIELSAFRIVQESVTNVVRHAGADRCQVVLTCGAEDLAIEVADGGSAIGVGAGVRGGGGGSNGSGSGSSGGSNGGGSGYGLVGIRERVTLLHGDFAAGPRPEGGFLVAARLPIPTVGV